MKTFAVAISTGLVLTSVAPAFAQTSPTREQRDSRYQIGMMEGVLEKAVEHGAALMRDRLRSVLPADMLLAEPARARGIRLEGYGVLFDIDVPTLQSAPLWSLQALDQNNVGLESAVNALRSSVKASGDATLEQALQRIELNLPPLPTVVGTSTVQPIAVPESVTVTGAQPVMVSGSAASTSDTARLAAADPLLSDPNEAYRTEIKAALMDAMLDHSRGLGIGANEWLVVAARRGNERSTLTGVDTDIQTVVIRIKGSDLADFLGDRINHEQARQWAECIEGITTVAVDGSQLQPWRDASIPVALVQIGFFVNPHSVGRPYTKDVRMEVLAPDDIAEPPRKGDEDSDSYPYSDMQVTLRRYLLEIDTLCVQMEQLAQARQSGDPVHSPVVFFDGSLVVSCGHRPLIAE